MRLTWLTPLWVWLWRIGLPVLGLAAATLTALAVLSHNGPYVLPRDFSTGKADHQFAAALDLGWLWIVDVARTPGSPPPQVLAGGTYVRGRFDNAMLTRPQLLLEEGAIIRDRKWGTWRRHSMRALRLAPLAVGALVLFAGLCWLTPGQRVLLEWEHAAKRLWRPRRGERLRRRGFDVVGQ